MEHKGSVTYSIYSESLLYVSLKLMQYKVLRRGMRMDGRRKEREREGGGGIITFPSVPYLKIGVKHWKIASIHSKDDEPYYNIVFVAVLSRV